MMRARFRMKICVKKCQADSFKSVKVTRRDADLIGSACPSGITKVSTLSDTDGFSCVQRGPDRYQSEHTRL